MLHRLPAVQQLHHLPALRGRPGTRERALRPLHRSSLRRLPQRPQRVHHVPCRRLPHQCRQAVRACRMSVLPCGGESLQAA